MAVPSHASVLPTFTGMALDRASAERKEGEWVRRKLEDPGARLLTATQEGVALTKVRWVDRGDVRRALAGDDSVFRLPPPGCRSRDS